MEPSGRRVGAPEFELSFATQGQGTRASQPARILSSTHALTELAMYAGQGLDAIRDVPPAGELMARLWKECLDAN